MFSYVCPPSDACRRRIRCAIRALVDDFLREMSREFGGHGHGRTLATTKAWAAVSGKLA